MESSFCTFIGLSHFCESRCPIINRARKHVLRRFPRFISQLAFIDSPLVLMQPVDSTTLQ